MLILSSAMRIEKFLNDYILEPDMITAQQMLAVVVFPTGQNNGRGIADVQ